MHYDTLRYHIWPGGLALFFKRGVRGIAACNVCCSQGIGMIEGSYSIFLLGTGAGIASLTGMHRSRQFVNVT